MRELAGTVTGTDGQSEIKIMSLSVKRIILANELGFPTRRSYLLCDWEGQVRPTRTIVVRQVGEIGT